MGCYILYPRGIRHLEILNEKIAAVTGVWVVLAMNSSVVSQVQLTHLSFFVKVSYTVRECSLCPRYASLPLFYWFPRSRFYFAHRATQVAWARDPISNSICVNRDGILLLELGVLIRLGNITLSSTLENKGFCI